MNRILACSRVVMALALPLLFLSACKTPPAGAPGTARPAPTATAPQYVRVAQFDGRWWFVRGDERFIALGVNCVLPAGDTQVPGAPHYDVLPKYNHDKMQWARDAADRLRIWNFNTVAAWSEETLYNHFPLYHTRVVWMGNWSSPDARDIDVFSASFAANLDRVAREHIAPHATNEYLIGYFSQNEMPWYGARGWPTAPDEFLLTRFMELPPLAPGKVKAVEFLRAFYTNDFAAFTSDWRTSAATFDELPHIRRMRGSSRMAQKPALAWAGLVAEEYYRLCAEVIRRHDPNHLYLGTRFAYRAQEAVMAACGRHCDVISINQYRRDGVFDARCAGAIAALTQKPIMLTEFSWRAMENSSGCPNSGGADVTVQTQQERADRCRSYMTAALAQPYIVGLDWFQYFDQPPQGRFDGENSNYGLVDVNDQFYTTLLGALTEINGKARDLHAQSTATLPAYDPEVLLDFREIRVPGGERPLSQPIVFADTTSPTFLWGDYGAGAKIEIEPTATNTWHIRVTPGSGWGAGITFQPSKALLANADGSVNCLGGAKVVLRIAAPETARIGIGLNESGHGAVNAQTYSGVGQADGESFRHEEQAGSAGNDRREYQLRKVDNNYHYGNQRGNKTIDTEAISTIDLFVPGHQPPFEAELSAITVE